MFAYWYWVRRRTRFSYKPVILITGCSSGIGLAIAELLHRYRSYRIYATARAGSLADLKKRFGEDERFFIRELDVTSEASRNHLYTEIENKWGGVDILVNCAGISYRAVVEHMNDQHEHNQMATNYFGPVALIRKTLPYLRSRGRGKIINVSSMSGMLAMPTMASYSASKSALEGLSEALWYELKPLGINVSLIQPGFVRSKSFEKVYYTPESSLAERAGADEFYGDYYVNMKPFIARLMGLSLTTPSSIAKLILKVIRTENPPLWIPATLDAWIFYYLHRFLPRRLLLGILFALLPGVRKWAKKYTKKRRRSA